MSNKPVTRTEAIRNFLRDFTHPDLAGLYSPEMECQVNVARCGGEPADDVYEGRRWRGWTKDGELWKSFRIPMNAKTIPTYTDRPMSFDLKKYAEGIGMTGWNWQERKSMYLAFDFDAIVGHSDKHQIKLPPDELRRVQEAASAIPWVQVRKSSGGRGLHLYVYLKPVTTINHTEHAALGRHVLGLMSAQAGFDFSTKVDICGGNIWVWHKKMEGNQGLSLIKNHTQILDNISDSWRDHTPVIAGTQRRTRPAGVGSNSTSLEDLSKGMEVIQLDAEHLKLIQWLREQSNCMWSFDTDHHCLVTHTVHLAEAHKALQLRGIFDTMSKGTERGADQNCFAFPMRNGVWTIRRFSLGCKEAPTWEQDGRGWTKCYYNRDLTLDIVSRQMEGTELPRGGFIYADASAADAALRLMGVDIIDGIPAHARMRSVVVKTHKDGRLILEIKKDREDDGKALWPKWALDKGHYVRILPVKAQPDAEIEPNATDDSIRHVVLPNKTAHGWFLEIENKWIEQPAQNINLVLKSRDYGQDEINQIMGSAIQKPWTSVMKPFEPEYPGNREWNRDAPQLRIVPSQGDELSHPTWDKILAHVGASLNEALQTNDWAKQNGIKTGADYLKCIFASIIKEPYEPTPYIFMWGGQASGKSILHEALNLLISNGILRADNALISTSNFNGELKKAVVAVVEEIDLNTNKMAYNRMKDWVTGLTISIHAKGETPYEMRNMSHWFHCANEWSYLPKFTGDTRITVINVSPLDPMEMIPKKMLMPMLEREAPDFLASLLRLEIPPSPDRLNVPVIATADKQDIEQANENMLEQFCRQKVYPCDGAYILFSEFKDRFLEYVGMAPEAAKWTTHKISQDISHRFLKGRATLGSIANQVILGNISFDKDQLRSQHKFHRDERGFLRLGATDVNSVV